MVNRKRTGIRTKMIVRLAVALCLAAAAAAFAGPAGLSAVLDLSSKDIQARGWTPEEDPFVAGDEAALSMVINGAAPRYMELGTRGAGFANYEKGDVYLMVEIYETKGRESAGALYREFAPGKEESINGLGDDARLIKEMGGSMMLEFIRGRFLVRLNITGQSADARADIQACAGSLASRIDETTGN